MPTRIRQISFWIAFGAYCGLVCILLGETLYAGIWPLSASAQTLATTGAGTPPKPSYVGPGNIVSGATAWYGLRAYTAAIAATGTQSAVDLRRPADNATCTPKIATNGSVDLTVGTPCNSNTQTVTSWVGSAATCTGAIGPASTTITVTSCSVGSLTVGALITGAGVSASTYVTAVVGGCTAVSSCTVSVSQTVASTTLTAAPSVPLVSKWYDQSGNINDWVQGTAANQPGLGLSVQNSLPAVQTTSASSQTMIVTLPSAIGANSSKTFVVAGGYRAAIVGSPIVSLGANSNGSAFGIAEDGTGKLVLFQWGAAFDLTTSTAVDTSWHSFTGIKNADVLTIREDQTQLNSATVSTANMTSYVLSLSKSPPTSATYATLSAGEIGLWPLAITSPIALETNIKSYWGTP